MIYSLEKCNKSFVDTHGDTCQKYLSRHWCSSTGGYGENWHDGLGSFENYSTNGESALVCPQCGCHSGS